MLEVEYQVLVFALLISVVGFAQKYTKADNSEVTRKWNETTFYSSKTFSENITEVASFSALSKNLELEATSKAIQEEEMITIFAMTNNAYEKLNAVQDSIFNTSLVANKVAIIKYHVIPGRVDSHSIKKAVERKGGIAQFSTLQGEKLGIKEDNGQLYLLDSQ